MPMTTSWEEVSSWYDKIVGSSGHYFHEHIILPRLLDLFAFDRKGDHSLLDLGCGSGVLGNHLPPHVNYFGVDISKGMIEKAKRNKRGKFKVQDVSAPLDLEQKEFSHITLILSLQNMKSPYAVLTNAKKYLSKNGSIFIVLNHPCFRIPRQTSWGIDEEKKIQYRRIDRYLSPLEIPIAMHPGSGAKSEETLSYHYPVSTYINMLGELGLGVVKAEEWASDKESFGKLAKMENRARSEFPLFLLLVAKHLSA